MRSPEYMVNKILAKSILNKHKRRDDWFLNDYSVNPYLGCSFNSIYCYAREQVYALKEKFRIAPGKEKLIMDYLPILKKTIERMGGKWIGCYITSLGEGEYGDYEMIFEFDEFNWLEKPFDKLEEIPESKSWEKFTCERGNKILKLRY